MQVQAFGGVPLDISDFPTRHPYGLALWQVHFERILAGWVVDELGVTLRREREVVGFAQDERGVDVALSDGSVMRAGYLVGCDGGRSERPACRRHRVRRLGPLGQLDHRRGRDGGGAAVRHPARRGHRTVADGGAAIGGSVRVVLAEQSVGATGEPTLQDLRDGSRRHRRDGLRRAQSVLDLPLHRHDAPSRGLSAGPRPARRRRGPRACAGGRTGPQHRRAGCREPRLEAGPGGPGPLARESPGQLPRGTAPDRRPGPPQHDGADRTPSQRRPHRGAAGHRRRAPGDGRAPPPLRRHAVRPRHPLRPRRRASAARPAHARPRPRDGVGRIGPHLRPAPSGPSRPADVRPAGWVRHRSVGRSGAGRRRHLRRRLGAPRHRRGPRTPGRADPARRLRGLGRGGGRSGTARGALPVVRRGRQSEPEPGQ